MGHKRNERLSCVVCSQVARSKVCDYTFWHDAGSIPAVPIREEREDDIRRVFEEERT